MGTGLLEVAAVGAERRSLASGRPWRHTYVSLVLLCDGFAVTLGLLAGVSLRFGDHPTASLHGLAYACMPLVLGPLWMATLAAQGTYRLRSLGAGATEYRQVLAASFQFVALVAIACYLGKAQLSRGFVAISLPITVVLLLAGRRVARKWLHVRRARGHCLVRVMAVGDPTRVHDLTQVMARERYAGYDVVAACLPGESCRLPDSFPSVPVIRSLAHVVPFARELGIDTVALTVSAALTADDVRRLSWDLEGTGIGMLVSPSLTDVAGPRIHVAQVAGLPLLHVDEPEFRGIRRLLKEVTDRIAALALLLTLSPLLAAIAVLVRLTSPGPALFRQRRVGKDGTTFEMFKFRTMEVNAEDRLEHYRHANEADADGVLFKIRQDPRVTPLGRRLRRYSLDELPQLWNVIRGDMALVGPRPPLPAEVDRYGSATRRRLLVKPGITGLWQVSGRSDLSWQDSVRLDLYYVENWSPALDLVIIWRTFFAVTRGSGAY